MTRGRMSYVTKDLADLIDEYQSRKGCKTKSEAQLEIKKDAIVGMAVEDIANFKFFNYPKRRKE